MRVGFEIADMNERGSSVAIFDYAYHTRRLLGYEPVIFYNSVTQVPRPVYDRFREQFELAPYGSFGELERETETRNIDVSYFLRSGKNDGRLCKSTKNVIHCMFQRFDPHGDTYAYISSWLAAAMTGGRYRAVPHIVSLPPSSRDLRGSLGIPKDACVIGRHGGYTEFNLRFAHRAVVETVSCRRDLYFIFVNTRPFCSHERVLFLPAIVDTAEKSDFINACDFMLHGRARGESFGLAMAEFMFFDKPVLCWAGGTDRNHLHILQDKRFVYKRYSDLLRLLLAVQPSPGNGSWSQVVEQFSPDRVVQQFKEVFIDAPPIEIRRRRDLKFVIKRRIEQRVLKARYDLWRKGVPV